MEERKCRRESINNYEFPTFRSEARLKIQEHDAGPELIEALRAASAQSLLPRTLSPHLTATLAKPEMHATSTFSRHAPGASSYSSTRLSQLDLSKKSLKSAWIAIAPFTSFHHAWCHICPHISAVLE